MTSRKSAKALGWLTCEGLTLPGVPEDAEQLGLAQLGGADHSVTQEDRLAVAYISDLHLCYSRTILLLGIYPREMKMCPQGSADPITCKKYKARDHDRRALDQECKAGLTPDRSQCHSPHSQIKEEKP